MVSEKVEKTFTRKEVEAHNCTKEGAWIIIHDGIYDVSKFLDEHPGGEEVLLEQAGKDGTAEFEDVGHSSDARDMMKDYKIGVLDEVCLCCLACISLSYKLIDFEFPFFMVIEEYVLCLPVYKKSC
ncbi:hypothetical protein QYM36_002809 [Artemia franciscana]|uniref:Cytochrome b5 heme-binding domain-containing protein n=1 Tax=Artemia franciscana TaxID=6661 RepID=A0AA88I407_ARTSF|nr:hypothetical protein QYM36_002809 [Artemia franciscana]